MTTNKDNDASERSGCYRKRTAGEMPMSDLTSHTRRGIYRVMRYQEGKFWNNQ
ncbi:hypothetical protein QLT07_05020 [Streptococcus equi subsp. zooepidemicus]|uniref:hypothetical protein n=1 Tax=Streptococcus equi TaxID=1336 RepID=UPI0024A9EEBC|nr:hypothetical protein [Streptococcus equi]MCD3443568.1 hypothetical protein [Streptococcus equi subsp. zooepidemicus]MDI6043936.1 hypothetical protein [Streptococcus equi subsp. zooepidemicus]HEL0024059.1 hypothetical protein [Streptococcus equi subsp. zooepidemicus]HEL0679025.1 hypothetical protein [Streptococcus equi subsp. zooepidemicus]HEL1085336.1 hypothetical protein [Streptococcus equi subsp. zooepidemicus]